MDKYDVVIIGGGPAGLTAGIYASRAGARALIIERNAVGGQSNYAAELENYPGLDGISGVELAEKMREQAIKCGAEILSDEVISLDVSAKTVLTAYNGEVAGNNIIIASGTKNRRLGVPDEEKFIGAGISYCAVCDGGFFRKKRVIVAGGGNTAFKDALYLSKLCEKVYLVHRREGFRAEKTLIDRVKACDNIEMVLNCTVTGLVGNDRLTAAEITNKLTGEKSLIEVSGVFVAIGVLPETEITGGKIKLDDNGYILTDEYMKTNIEGIYAAGDVRSKPLRQIITAAADGAIAAQEASGV